MTTELEDFIPLHRKALENEGLTPEEVEYAMQPLLSFASTCLEGDAKTSSDWVEDFQHENGRYWNVCKDCSLPFRGHKRRVTCKACASTLASF